MQCRAVRAVLAERTVPLRNVAECGDALSARLIQHLRVIISDSVVTKRLDSCWRLLLFLCEMWRQQTFLYVKRESIVYVQKVIIAFPWVVAHQTELTFLTC